MNASEIVPATDGALIGIVSIDDVLDIVAEQLRDVVRAVAREQVRETRTVR